MLHDDTLPCLRVMMVSLSLILSVSIHFIVLLPHLRIWCQVFLWITGPIVLRKK